MIFSVLGFCFFVVDISYYTSFFLVNMVLMKHDMRNGCLNQDTIEKKDGGHTSELIFLIYFHSALPYFFLYSQWHMMVHCNVHCNVMMHCKYTIRKIHFYFGEKSLRNALWNMITNMKDSSPLGPWEQKLSLPSSKGVRDYLVSDNDEQMPPHISSVLGCHNTVEFSCFKRRWFIQSQGVVTLISLFIQSAVFKWNFKIS